MPESSRFTSAWQNAIFSPSRPRVRVNAAQPPRFGQSIIGMPLCLNGRIFAHGLGAHADSIIEVILDAPAKTLRGWAGIDENPGSRESLAEVKFSVEADGKQLWESPLSKWSSAASPVEVDLNGATRFTLKAIAPSGWIHYAHADWADLRVTFEDGTEAWIGETVESQRLPQKPIFSFNYGGRPFSDLLPECRLTEETEAADGYTLHRYTYNAPDQLLTCILEIKEFTDLPALEWLVRLRNDGGSDTPIVEDLQALDIDWVATSSALLHRSRGSRSSVHDFAYQVDAIEPGGEIGMVGGGGRSSDNWLPYFNLQTGDCGIVAAIGWSGQWSAKLSRDGDRITFRAGMERTHFTLHSGEEIRSPRVALLFWEGKPIDGNNLLRRLIIDHYTHRVGGRLLQAPITSGIWGGVKTEGDLLTIAFLQEHQLEYDAFWMDAGWYGTAESYSPFEMTGKWYDQPGNWNPNPIAHPGGLREVGDAAHRAGMKFLLWLEPERAVWGTTVTREHPEWFLGEKTAGKNVLLDLGNAAARRWAVGIVAAMVEEWGVDIFRQDFNFEPLPYWRAADAPDRQGMAEIGHIQGLYAFWDELLSRYPHLMIDNCASGGRRIDLETTSRSIPLWRSDYQCNPSCDPIGAQIHTAGLSYWIPLSGTATQIRDGDTYNFRSALSAAVGFGAIPSEVLEAPVTYEWEWRRTRIAEYKRARPFYYGAYYPLTRFSIERDVWFAYQMHRPDLGSGMVLAFRREECVYPAAQLSLSGLDGSRPYRLENPDTGETWTCTGDELCRGGLIFSMPKPRASQIVFYEAAG